MPVRESGVEEQGEMPSIVPAGVKLGPGRLQRVYGARQGVYVSDDDLECYKV